MATAFLGEIPHTAAGEERDVNSEREHRRRYWLEALAHHRRHDLAGRDEAVLAAHAFPRLLREHAGRDTSDVFERHGTAMCG